MSEHSRHPSDDGGWEQPDLDVLNLFLATVEWTEDQWRQLGMMAARLEPEGPPSATTAEALVVWISAGGPES